MPPNQPSQYDFILNHNPPKKSPLGFGGGQSMAKRVLIIAGGAAVLLILLVIGYNLMFGAKDDSVVLRDLAATQLEVSRVAFLGSGARDRSLADTAITVSMVVNSHSNDTLALLKQRKVKINEKQLGYKKNTKTDDRLAQAQSNNTFTATFEEVLRATVTNYRAAIKKAYDSTDSRSAKQALSSQYENMSLIFPAESPAPAN